VGKRHIRYALILKHEEEKQSVFDGKAWYVSICAMKVAFIN